VTTPMARTIFFTIYGMIIGAGYTALLLDLSPDHPVGIVIGGVALSAMLGFFGSTLPRDPSHSNAQLLAVVPLVPFVFCAGLIGVGAVVPILAVVLPFLAVKGFFRERKFLRQLKSRHRFVTLRRLRPRLEAGEGTLIEEWGLKGPYRIWWTGEDIRARGTPLTLDDYRNIMQCKDNAFNAQCVQDYLEPETGRALLTNIRPRAARNGGLQRLFLGVPVVMLVQSPNPSGVKIVGILPAHDGQAAIRIANSTDQIVDLEGWRVFDPRVPGNESRLKGEVPPGGNLVVALAGTSFSFKVDGGDVLLLSENGGVCHMVSYTSEQVRRGEWVEVD